MLLELSSPILKMHEWTTAQKLREEWNTQIL